MRIIRIFLIGILILPFLGTLFMVQEVSGDSVGPEITDVYHYPKYPQVDDNVTVFATVSDPDGLFKIQLTYCKDVCVFLDMNGPDSNDVFWKNITWDSSWGGGTVLYYEIIATDNLTNSNDSGKTYFFYASEINMSNEMTATANTGESIFLNGSAFYNNNATAPVENSNVTVKILGTQNEYYSKTDNFGNFSMELEFEEYGEFQVNITLSNGTLAAYDERTITVRGISHLSINVQMTTCYPGQQIWVNGTSKYDTQDPVLNSDVEIKINETLFWGTKTDSNGDYQELITVPSELGQYMVNATIINGTMTAYNSTEITVTEVPLPDLVMSGVDINFSSEKTPPLENEEVNITVVIHNLGSAQCQEILVNFYDGIPSPGNLIDTATISQIEVGSTSSVSILWTAINGSHDIWIEVDPLNATLESFENNNNGTLAIFVDGDFDEDGIGDLVDDDDDGDELLDTEEIAKGTDPKNPDTDGDGVFDKLDYDPLDPDVTEEPTSEPWMLFIIIIAVVVVVIVLVTFMIKRKK